MHVLDIWTAQWPRADPENWGCSFSFTFCQSLLYSSIHSSVETRDAQHLRRCRIAQATGSVGGLSTCFLHWIYKLKDFLIFFLFLSKHELFSCKQTSNVQIYLKADPFFFNRLQVSLSCACTVQSVLTILLYTHNLVLILYFWHRSKCDIRQCMVHTLRNNLTELAPNVTVKCQFSVCLCHIFYKHSGGSP